MRAARKKVEQVETPIIANDEINDEAAEATDVDELLTEVAEEIKVDELLAVEISDADKRYEAKDYLQAAMLYYQLGDNKTGEQWYRYGYSLFALTKTKPWQAAAKMAHDLDPKNPHIMSNYQLLMKA